MGKEDYDDRKKGKKKNYCISAAMFREMQNRKKRKIHEGSL